MYNKLLSTSILCIFLGASSMVFGSEGLILRVELNHKNQKKDVRYYDQDGKKIIAPDTINRIEATKNNPQTLIFDTLRKTFIRKEEASTTTTTTMTTSNNTKDCFEQLSKLENEIINQAKDRALSFMNRHGNKELSSCILELIEYKKQSRSSSTTIPIVESNSSNQITTDEQVAALQNIVKQATAAQKDPENEAILNDILEGALAETIANNSPSAALGQQPTNTKEVADPNDGLQLSDEEASDESKKNFKSKTPNYPLPPTKFAILKKFVFKTFVTTSAFTAILGLITFLQHRYPAFTAEYYPSLMTQFTTTQLAPLFASLGKRLNQPMLAIKRFMQA
jgi:hypothetical protein